MNAPMSRLPRHATRKVNILALYRASTTTAAAGPRGSAQALTDRPMTARKSRTHQRAS
jgi:hypothetical protein